MHKFTHFLVNFWDFWITILILEKSINTSRDNNWYLLLFVNYPLELWLSQASLNPIINDQQAQLGYESLMLLYLPCYRDSGGESFLLRWVEAKVCPPGTKNINYETYFLWFNVIPRSLGQIRICVGLEVSQLWGRRYDFKKITSSLKKTSSFEITSSFKNDFKFWMNSKF